MQTLTAGLTSLMVGGRHCFATCWLIERRDGTVFRFTDHDNAVVVDGSTFTPGGAANTSARQRVEGVEPQNAEVRGAVASGLITETDLQAGRYRGAKITEFVVDWRFPWAGKFSTNVYYVEETTFDGEKWTARLLGQKVRLQPKVGELFTRTCRYDLGDADCGVALAGLTVSGTISTIVADRRKFTTSLTSSDDYFVLGRVTFTSGANAGLRFDVKGYKNAGGEIELQVQTPFVVAIGDAFTVYPGCDRRDATCKTKFGNFARFGGYPTIPGSDKAFLTPDVRSPQ